MKKKRTLTGEEKEVEDSLVRGEFVDVGAEEFKDIAKSIKARQKDAVLNIRINSEDLQMIKKKSTSLGVKYQSFISEILHRVAHS